MPDEPENPTTPEAPAAEAEPEAEPTPSEELEQAEFEDDLALNGQPDDDEEAEEDDEPPSPPAPPPTAAERKRLADLVKDDPDLAREFQELTAQSAQAQARQAQEQARAALEQETLGRQWNESVAARNGQLAVRQQEDYALYLQGQSDVIAAQEAREAAMARRQTEDAWWIENDKWFRDRTQVSQATAQARTAEQQKIFSQVDRFYKSKLPAPVQQALSGKRYGGSFDDGFYENLSDLAAELIAYGANQREEQLKAQAKARREERTAQAQRGLAQETPEIAAGGRARRGGPTEADIDSWPLEKRLEELKKNPRLYDQVAMASANGRRR